MAGPSGIRRQDGKTTRRGRDQGARQRQIQRAFRRSNPSGTARRRRRPERRARLGSTRRHEREDRAGAQGRGRRLASPATDGSFRSLGLRAPHAPPWPGGCRAGKKLPSLIRCRGNTKVSIMAANASGLALCSPCGHIDTDDDRTASGGGGKSPRRPHSRISCRLRNHWPSPIWSFTQTMWVRYSKPQRAKTLQLILWIMCGDAHKKHTASGVVISSTGNALTASHDIVG